ncbi:MAG TPA: response regulator [Candidatus Obscuribacterales bacterium]
MTSILVVEDDEDLLSTMMEWLAFHGHTVYGASSGEEGLRKMMSGNFDVIILDWQLPGMAGIEVVKAYRSAGGKIPVLMLTGRRDPKEKEACLAAGASEFLTKPFRLEQLSQQIGRVLNSPIV